MTASGRRLPSGTLTFLRTDIEGSMALVRALGAGYDDLDAEHKSIVRGALADHGGVEVRTEGDAFFAVFEDAPSAVAAAADIQRAMTAHGWPGGRAVRLRIGLHAGTANLAGDDYGGFEVGRAARIAAMGSGGQIVLSEAVRALVAESLPPGCSIRALGSYQLRDTTAPARLYQLDVPGLPTEFPPLRSPVRPVERLPVRLTSFVGRDDALRSLDGLLASTRLLTLTGPGGTGKTSLAVELARSAAGRFADGAWFVDLQTVTEASQVSGAVARTLGLFDGPGSPAADRLVDHLASRELLLVLDNFEQVIDAAGHLGTWLRAAPGLRTLVTSRAPLRISGEQEYPVRPLSLGSNDARQPSTIGGEGSTPSGPMPSAAEQLFEDRLRAVQPDLVLGPAERQGVADICRLLDGLPLAIELAAARGASLPLELIRDRLAAHLPLPGSGPRDLPDRQRTLEATIAWSHDLLPGPARALLARLAVFEDGFDIEQATEAFGPLDGSGADVVDGIMTLDEQSLIGRVDRRAAGPGRYRMLETVRTYGLARLVESGEERAMRTRHAEAFVTLARRAAHGLHGAERRRWLDRLEHDDANITAALRWSVESGDVDRALALAGSLWRYWVHGGRLATGRRLVKAALAMPASERAGPARLAALDAAGGLAYWSGDRQRADALYREQLELARALGDRAAEGLAAFNSAHTRGQLDDMPGALAALDLATRRFGEVGDEIGMARVEWTRATMATLVDPTAAEERMRASLVRFEALGDAPYVALACGGLSWIDVAQGRPDDAFIWMVRSCTLDRALGDKAHMTVGLAGAAVIAMALGLAEDAAVMQGAFAALSARFGVDTPAPLEMIIGHSDSMATARDVLGPERFEAAVARGASMDLDAALDHLLDLAASRGVDIDALTTTWPAA